MQVADAARPSGSVSPTSASREFDKIGISVEPVSPQLVTRARLDSKYRSGLLVSDVKAAGRWFG
jgi:hypothetical protein